MLAQTARIVLEHKMVVIVGHRDVSVEQLCHRATLPAVGALRPSRCPLCDHPGQQRGKPVGIVGHGTYTRQVLGVGKRGRQVLMIVRRYLCRGCERTISVLPAALYPGRWYAGIVIVLCLFLKLARGRSAAQIQRRFGEPNSNRAEWRTLRRWRRQLLCPMWSWLAEQLGCDVAPAHDCGEQVRWLRQMLALHGVGPPSALRDVVSAATALVRSTAHDGVRGSVFSLD